MGDPIKDIVQIELHLNRLMALRVLPQLTKKKHEHPETYSIISKTFIKKNIYIHVYICVYIYSPNKGRMENIIDFPPKNTDFSQNKGCSVTAEVSEKKDSPA